MGFKISWVAFQNMTRDEVLATAGLRDTRVRDEANEFPLSGAQVPGWYILFANDFTFASTDQLALLSRCCTVMGVQVHEGIMVSTARAFGAGEEMWSISHASDQGVFDLDTTGLLPIEFEAIRDRLIAEQQAAGGAAADVDYLFDIPVEMAAAVCGYRHDRWKFEWGEPQFTVLEAR